MSDRDVMWRNGICITFPIFILSGATTVAVFNREVADTESQIEKRDRGLYTGYSLLTIGLFMMCVCGMLQFQINRKVVDK